MMKTFFKISSGLVLASLVLLPLLVFAAITTTQTPPESCTMRATWEDCPASGSLAEFDKSYPANAPKVSGSVCCLMSTVLYVTNWIFTLLMAVAVIMIIIGGFFMVAAAGNEDQFKKGKTMITYAVVGILVALLAKFAPGLVKFIVGV